MLGAMRTFARFADRISTYVGYMIAGMVPLTVVVLFIEVGSRYILRQPTNWAQETAIFLFFCVGLLAGAYAMRKNAHINVDIVYGRFGARGRAILDLLTAPVMIFFLALIILYGWDVAADALSRNAFRPTEPNLPQFPFLVLIPVGAGLVLMQAIAGVLRNLHLAVTGRHLDE